MIKIITEAKQDFLNLENALFDYMKRVKHIKDDEFVRGSVHDWVEEFKLLKDYIPKEKRDIYNYWIKRFKTDDTQQVYMDFVQGLYDADELRKNAAAIKKQKDDFINSCPAYLVRKFEQYKNQLSVNKREYGYWLEREKVNVGALEKELRRFGYTEEERKVIEEGSRLIYEDDEWDIYRITNYLACEYYGKGTGWCISGNYPGHESRGEHHFNSYLKNCNPKCYYIALKNGDSVQGAFCFFVEDGDLKVWDGTNGEDKELADLEMVEATDESFPVEQFKGIITKEANIVFPTEEDYEQAFKDCLEQYGTVSTLKRADVSMNEFVDWIVERDFDDPRQFYVDFLESLSLNDALNLLGEFKQEFDLNGLLLSYNNGKEDGIVEKYKGMEFEDLSNEDKQYIIKSFEDEFANAADMNDSPYGVMYYDGRMSDSEIIDLLGIEDEDVFEFLRKEKMGKYFYRGMRMDDWNTDYIPGYFGF